MAGLSRGIGAVNQRFAAAAGTDTTRLRFSGSASDAGVVRGLVPVASVSWPGRGADERPLELGKRLPHRHQRGDQRRVLTGKSAQGHRPWPESRDKDNTALIGRLGQPAVSTRSR